MSALLTDDERAILTSIMSAVFEDKLGRFVPAAGDPSMYAHDICAILLEVDRRSAERKE